MTSNIQYRSRGAGAHDYSATAINLPGIDVVDANTGDVLPTNPRKKQRVRFTGKAESLHYDDDQFRLGTDGLLEAKESRSDGTTQYVNVGTNFPGPVFVSVKQYGAKGDGQTDDTLAFKDAFMANDNVYVPSGTYMVGQYAADNTSSGLKTGGIRLTGRKLLVLGPQVTLKAPSGLTSGASVAIIYITGDYNTVMGRGATLDYNENTQDNMGGGDVATLMIQSGNNNTVEELRAINPGDNVAANFRAAQSSHCTFRNCYSVRANKNYRAHHFQLGKNNTYNRYIDCTAEGSFTDDGRDEDGFRLYNSNRRNVFMGCVAKGTRAGFQEWGNGSRDNHFIGCHAVECRTYGLAALATGGTYSVWSNNSAYNCGRAGFYIRSPHITVNGYTGKFNSRSGGFFINNTLIKKGPDNSVPTSDLTVDMVVEGFKCTVTGTNFFDPSSSPCAAILNLGVGNSFVNCATRTNYTQPSGYYPFVTTTTDVSVIGGFNMEYLLYTDTYRPVTDTKVFLAGGGPLACERAFVRGNTDLQGRVDIGDPNGDNRIFDLAEKVRDVVDKSNDIYYHRGPIAYNSVDLTATDIAPDTQGFKMSTDSDFTDGEWGVNKVSTGIFEISAPDYFNGGINNSTTVHIMNYPNNDGSYNSQMTYNLEADFSSTRFKWIVRCYSGGVLFDGVFSVTVIKRDLGRPSNMQQYTT